MRQNREEASTDASSKFHFHPHLQEDVGCDHSGIKIAQSQDKQAGDRLFPRPKTKPLIGAQSLTPWLRKKSLSHSFPSDMSVALSVDWRTQGFKREDKLREMLVFLFGVSLCLLN